MCLIVVLEVSVTMLVIASNKKVGGCNCADVRFYHAVTLQDPDDDQKHYSFDLADPAHGACFNIGMGPDGSPLISWSDLHALYELPDGTKWAEHGFFHDAEDMVSPYSHGANISHIQPCSSSWS